MFRFRISYYKASGKWHLDADVEWRIAANSKVGTTPYLPDAVTKLRGHRQQSSLPGLASGSWDGPILIRHLDGTEDGGLSHLLMPT